MYQKIKPLCSVSLRSYTNVYFAASLPKNGASAGVADPSDHGSQRGGQGTLAQAGGALRARAPAPAPAHLAAPRPRPAPPVPTAVDSRTLRLATPHVTSSRPRHRCSDTRKPVTKHN